MAEWEQRVADLWASFDDDSEEEFMARMRDLVAELPADSAVGTFELGSAFDSTSHPDQAVSSYRRALELGLDGGMPGCSSIAEAGLSLDLIPERLDRCKQHSFSDDVHQGKAERQCLGRVGHVRRF